MAATCSQCGEKLKLLERARGQELCKRHFAEQQTKQQAARQKYPQLLEQLVASPEPTQLIPTVQETARVARLTPEERRSIAGAIVERQTLEILADDFASAEEEEDLVRVMKLLEFSWEDFQTANKDVFHRLVIAEINGGSIPVVSEPTIMTKAGELVHRQEAATLLKEVAIREYQGGYSGFSFRIAKGVRYNVGGMRGRSVVVGTKMEEADSGTLVLTSIRAVFIGTKSTIEMPYTKLVNLSVYSDGIQFHLSNRKTAPLFRLETGDVDAAIVNAAVQRL